MNTLTELIASRFAPEAKVRAKPKREALAMPILTKSEKPFDKYEAEVFNFLLANKKALGIKTITKYTALLVDGAVELVCGKRLSVEVRFRMNWDKACQAEWQFRNFLKRHAKDNVVDGGLVFFEQFSGDWSRKVGSRLLENGWNHWYHGHAEVEGFDMHLVRLCNQKLQSFPLADAILSKMETLPSEEIVRIIERLGAGSAFVPETGVAATRNSGP